MPEIVTNPTVPEELVPQYAANILHDHNFGPPKKVRLNPPTNLLLNPPPNASPKPPPNPSPNPPPNPPFNPLPDTPPNTPTNTQPNRQAYPLPIPPPYPPPLIMEVDQTLDQLDDGIEFSLNTVRKDGSDHFKLVADDVQANINDVHCEQVVSEDVLETLRRYKEELDKKVKEIEALKKKNEELESAVAILKKFLTNDQIYRLMNPKSRSPWSDLTLQNCIDMFYHCGTSGYNLLIKMGFPLAKPRTLQNHLRKLACEPGSLHDVFRILRVKVPKMPEAHRKCVFVVDEMQLQAKKEYDPVKGVIMGAPTVPPSKELIAKRAKKGKHEKDFMAQKLFNGMIAGYLYRFRQIVFFEFTDVSFDKEIMARKVVEVITDCQHCGLDVMTFAGDMGMLGI